MWERILARGELDHTRWRGMRINSKQVTTRRETEALHKTTGLRIVRSRWRAKATWW